MEILISCAVLHKEISGKIVCLVVAIISRVPVLRRKSPKLKSEVDTISSKFNQAMRKHMLDRDILVFATLISMTVWVLRILRLWLAFKALGVEVPIHYALIVETTTSVISFFPAIPGAVGIWEGTSVAIFMALGIPKAIATAGTILSRIFFYLLPSFIGVLAALSLGIGIRGILDVPGAMNRKVARQKAKQQPGRQ
ncbi:MAG: flippase-like domain-containing protein [Candidatus Altiarchaeota archaeon]|nr:flippase-like domain-containing protein [Candidatus Altiarchaeota archaeon]